MTTRTVRLSLVALTLIVAVVTLAACGGSSDKKETTATPPPQAQTSVQFSWVHTIEFAGFYEAEANQLYQNVGLTVDLRSGGYDADGNFIDPIQSVASGQADFGIVGGDALLLARAQGQPLVAIATIYQQNPVVLIALASAGITRPQDLVGQRVGVQQGTVTEREYVALLTAQKIDRRSITEVPLTTFTLDPLLNGELDVYPGFVTNQPVTLRQDGQDISMILPGDYGIDLYANVIFATEDTIANRADLVERFLKATLQGYTAAVADPAGAAKLSVAHNPDLTVENETASMQASLPLIQPAESQIGMMNGGVWEFMQNVLIEQGLLAEPLDLEQAYTLTFLKAIYP